MTQGSRTGRVVRVVLLPIVVIGAIVTLGRRRRRTGPGRGRGETGGGTAGDREPRNPLPTTLVDAGAGIPGD